MTDLVITAANVIAGSNAKKVQGIAGATITAGQVVYRDPTTQKFLQVDSDSGTEAVRNVFGIALNGASNGQPLMVQTEGDINLGAALTVGEIYVASDTAGGIMPEGDLELGDYPTILGVAYSTSVMKMKILAGGAALLA